MYNNLKLQLLFTFTNCLYEPLNITRLEYKLINLYSDDLILLFPNILNDIDQYLEGFDTFNNISDKDIKYNIDKNL